jgi:hypothetical protein
MLEWHLEIDMLAALFAIVLTASPSTPGDIQCGLKSLSACHDTNELFGTSPFRER